MCQRTVSSIIIIYFQLHATVLSQNMSSFDISMEQKLYDFIRNAYSYPVRPVAEYKDQLIVQMRFELLQVLDLNIKDQTLSMRFAIEMEWTADRFKWDPEDFGGLTRIYFPADQLWQPDLHLYKPQTNLNLQGKYAEIHFSGLVVWRPLASIKGNCAMKVDYYPFDIQSCELKLGSWTYEGDLLWLTLKDLPEDQKFNQTGMILPVGMDLTYLAPSTEWSLIELPGRYCVQKYDGFESSYPHVEFTLKLRRHAKFYLFNLVIPLIGLSYLCLLVFYLPADSGEKITLCTSLLTAQIMFLVLMIDNIPVTSLAVPLLGKLIIFNMLLIFGSIFCSTVVINLHCRKSSTHEPPNWVIRLNSSRLAKYLFLQQPANAGEKVSSESQTAHKRFLTSMESHKQHEMGNCSKSLSRVHRVVNNIDCIRKHFMEVDENDKTSAQWKLLAAIVDRVFFISFHIVYICFMIYFFSEAPALYNSQRLLGT